MVKDIPVFVAYLLLIDSKDWGGNVTYVLDEELLSIKELRNVHLSI